MDRNIASGQDFFSDAINQVAFSDSAETPFLSVDLVQFGVDPAEPTLARPGSNEKVFMLAARYAAGLPLWHDGDCYDHSSANGSDFGQENQDYADSPAFEEDFDDQDCELVGQMD